MAENLVAAADGQQDAAVLHVGMQLLAHVHELGRRQALLAVGAASQHDEVDAGEVDGLAVVDALDLHGDAAPAQALFEDAHVATVPVQVEQVGEEVRDGEGGGGRRSLPLSWRGDGTVAPTAIARAMGAGEALIRAMRVGGILGRGAGGNAV